MSMMNCPTYGTVECAAGVCFVCGGIGDETPRPCPPPEDVIQIDVVYGWRGLGTGGIPRRPTTLTTMTVLKPERDLRAPA